MFVECYRVVEHNGEKVIDYEGYTWARQLWEDEPDAVNGLWYAFTFCKECIVPIGERNYERSCAAFELAQQYQEDMTEGELLDFECDVKRGTYLHMDDVTQDTPCGPYWFEIDE